MLPLVAREKYSSANKGTSKLIRWWAERLYTEFNVSTPGFF
jgi:hypothetical protein